MIAVGPLGPCTIICRAGRLGFEGGEVESGVAVECGWRGTCLLSSTPSGQGLLEGVASLDLGVRARKAGAKDSVLLSSRDTDLLEPTEWLKGKQTSSGVWREDTGLLSRQCRK